MFPTTSSQEELYASVAAPVVDGCFNGIHGCVFVYGQTGSGKTFTMNGPTASFAAGSFTAEAGLIPRAMQAIYERKESSGEGAGTCVVVQLLCGRGGGKRRLYKYNLYVVCSPSPASPAWQAASMYFPISRLATTFMPPPYFI